MLYFREFGDRKNPTILLLPGAGMAQTFYCQYGFADRFHLVEVHLLGTGEEAAKKWSLRENIDGVLDIIKEIGKETAFRIISSVCFINDDGEIHVSQ